MKPILSIFIFVLLLSSNLLFAQYVRFPAAGIIEFEKSINMHPIIKKRINKNNEGFMQQAFDNYKRTQPQFMKLKSSLAFSKDKMLFSPATENAPSFFLGNDPMISQHNVIYTDLSSNTSISQKKVFEETFLVKDTTRRINWKITSETREIAGYPCRRANAIVLDSIYVVAFYTDNIPVSGGPESFTGLPGMILGVALPHENITWFATKVTDQPVPASKLSPPQKGKATDNKGLRTTIASALKNWGEYAQVAMKAFLL